MIVIPTRAPAFLLIRPSLPLVCPTSEMGLSSAAPADVSDPTDWLGTPLSSLFPVDAALRCHVCKDFYKSPLLTSCNHSFCSLCIRRCLAADGKCPVCRANDQEVKLRQNKSLGEVLEAFTHARQAVLAWARRPPVVGHSGCGSPKRKAEDLGAAEEMEGPRSKRHRMSTRSGRARGVEATTEIMMAMVEDPEFPDEAADDYDPGTRRERETAAAVRRRS